MSASVDYFFATISPWTYLGHERFVALAARAGAAVRLRPMDLGKVFPVSGGVPLGQRAPQRQAYRLVELQRYAEHLLLPLNPKPKFFPTSSELASRLVIATDASHGTACALRIAGACMRATWAQERDIGDADTLAALLRESSLDPALLDAARADSVAADYAAHSQAAIDAGVFGSPSYVIDGEIFWGQDRLDFVARKLGVQP
jgi:2-hydroxychromene-2-carboxylate isomerase